MTEDGIFQLKLAHPDTTLAHGPGSNIKLSHRLCQASNLDLTRVLSPFFILQAFVDIFLSSWFIIVSDISVSSFQISSNTNKNKMWQNKH